MLGTNEPIIIIPVILAITCALVSVGIAFYVFFRKSNTPHVDEFRIKHIEGLGYFAQANVTGTWQKIGAHDNQQFGLYDENDHNIPLFSSKDALERIENFKDWQVRSKGDVSYIIAT